jgi:hypothetical protein
VLIARGLIRLVASLNAALLLTVTFQMSEYAQSEALPMWVFAAGVPVWGDLSAGAGPYSTDCGPPRTARLSRTVMRRILVLGLAVLTTSCTVVQGPFQTAACTGAPTDPVGCIAKVAFGGIVYLDRGYVAITEDGQAKLAASGTLTTAVEWLPSPDRDARPMAAHDSRVNNYAGAAVWVVPEIEAGRMVLLGPFPQEWEPNLYEMFLAQGGSEDFPLGLCPYLKPLGTSKAIPPQVCGQVPPAP